MASLSFDDPKPVVEKRKQQQIFLRPSLKDEIEWAHCEGDYGEPEACPRCGAMIRAERFDVEDRDGIMRYSYEWRSISDGQAERRAG